MTLTQIEDQTYGKRKKKNRNLNSRYYTWKQLKQANEVAADFQNRDNVIEM